MSKIDLMDLKVKINKKTFSLIQDKCFKNDIFWEQSKDIKKEYDASYFCIYYRSATDSLQYGNSENSFNADSAKEVFSVDEFLQKIQ